MNGPPSYSIVSRQRVTCRIVPLGIGKPRSSSPGVIARAPGALDHERADIARRRRRCVRLSSSTSPGLPDASLPTVGFEQLDPLAFTSNQAPGTGLKARTCRSICSAARDQSIRASALSTLDA